MAVNDISAQQSVIDQYTRPESKEPKSNELGRDSFLELMVAQLNNQNPLNPTDNQAFVAQLAQFSTVEGIDKLNTTMDSLQSRFNSISALQATSMVGQSVIVDGNKTGLLLQNGIVSGYTDLAQSASNITLRISNKNGQMLEQIPIGNHGAGAMSIRWDGLNLMVDGKVQQLDQHKLNRQEYYKDEEGEFVLDSEGNKIPIPYPAGEYVFSLNGTVAGKAEELGMQMSSRVDSVTMNANGNVVLNLAGGSKATLDKIKQVLDE